LVFEYLQYIFLASLVWFFLLIFSAFFQLSCCWFLKINYSRINFLRRHILQKVRSVFHRDQRVFTRFSRSSC